MAGLINVEDGGRGGERGRERERERGGRWVKLNKLGLTKLTLIPACGPLGFELEPRLSAG